MEPSAWSDGLNAAVTVCNLDGTILYMNAKSKETFGKWGGDLTGKNLFDCHSEASRGKIRALMEHGKSNTYTIEKEGRRKLIHQTPWYREGKCAGLVEMSIELPEGMAHFKRD